MIIALTRSLSPKLASGERTHIDRMPIDMAVAEQQHAAYERCLEEQGCRIVPVKPLPDAPDGVFVEDTAVVLDEVAVITRPGAASRRDETFTVDEALRVHKKTIRMFEGTLDGGDVLRLGRILYVGRSDRTSDRGIAHLRSLVRPYGYEVVGVRMNDALHLKTAMTTVDDQTILVNPEWIADFSVPGYEMLPIDPSEPFAANVLRIRDSVIMPEEFPRTRAMLEKRGHRVVTVPTSELLKAEAGVTCSSIVFEG